MKRRFRFTPPKQRFAHASGRRMRPISLPCGVQTVTPLYPTFPPALLEHHTWPVTSHRMPSGEHLTLSIMKSEKRRAFDALAPDTSSTNRSPLPPGPVSPGPLPVLTTYTLVKS